MLLNKRKSDHDVFIVSSYCAQANMALFEACCKEKIQQFEDTGSDEEDIWDEKDVTFAPEAQRRPRYHTFFLEHIVLFSSLVSVWFTCLSFTLQELRKYR